MKYEWRKNSLKIKSWIFTFAIALMLSAAAFAFERTEPVSIDTSVDLSLLSNKQAQQTSAFERFDVSLSALPSNRITVPAAVGAMILNVHRPEITTVKELAGYRQQLLKPNIEVWYAFTSSTKGFSGLAGNHFARAGV